MTENLTGRVVAVATLPLGSVLVQDAPAGSSALFVEDAADFDEDGGSLSLNGEAVVYTACDDETGEVTLAMPTTSAALTDDRVEVYDPDAASLVVETVAQVLVEGTEQGGDPLEAIVDHALVAFLPEGIRDDSLGATGEAVTLEWRGDDLYVTNLIASPVVFDGSVIDPETIPDGVPTAPPVLSPSLVVKGTADGLVVRTVEAVEPTTVLTYHITATPPLDGAGNPLDFTPDATTQVGEPTRATVVLITELTDGSRLTPGTTYFLRAVASNVAGEAPPGPQATGSLDPSVVTDFVTGTITAGFALLGGIQVGQITIDPDSGITIPNPTGETRLPADGSPASFSGSVKTDDLKVDGGLTLNGETNSINGALSLANVVTPPTVAPTLSQTWDYTAPIGTDTWSLGEGISTSEWISVNTSTNTFKRFSKATGAQVASYGPYSGWKLWGATSVGSTYYLIAAKTTSPIDVYILTVNSSGVIQSSFRVATDANVGGIPGIGRDLSGNIMVSWAHTDAKTARVKKYATGSTVAFSDTYWDYTLMSTGTASGFTGSANLSVMGVGEAPLGRGGETQTWVGVNGVPVIFDTATKRVATWPGRPEGVKGAIWTADGHFKWLAYSTYRIYEFPIRYWDSPATVGYTWFDSDAASPGGQHETTLSPTASFQPWHFSKLQVSTPAMADNGNPDDPDSIRVYIDGHRQADLTPGVTLATYAAVSTTGAAPPTTNGFEGATAFPGKITSTSADSNGPLFSVLGNGSGRWGGLTVDALGKTILNGDSGWIAVTTFTVGWENYGGTYAPAAYRKIGDRVFLRGLVRSGPTGSIFTLPAGFRPPYDALFPAIVNAVTEEIDATGDGAKTLQTTGTNNGSTPAHTHDVTVTAYDIHVSAAFSNIAARLAITSAGVVTLSDANASTGYVSLEGISFFVT